MYHDYFEELPDVIEDNKKVIYKEYSSEDPICLNSILIDDNKEIWEDLYKE